MNTGSRGTVSSVQKYSPEKSLLCQMLQRAIADASGQVSESNYTEKAKMEIQENAIGWIFDPSFKTDGFKFKDACEALDLDYKKIRSAIKDKLDQKDKDWLCQ